MDKKVLYKGITAAPSDYLCSDGDLSVAMNMMQENGSLYPVGKPKTVFSLNNGETVLYIHKTAVFEHFIVQKGYTLYWRTKEDTTLNIIKGFNDGIENVYASGNTLVVSLTSETAYFLWATEEGVSKYKYLGERIPDIILSLGLQGEFKKYRSSTYSMGDKRIFVPNIKRFIITDEDFVRSFTDFFVGFLNTSVVNATTSDRSNGKFVMPFFVRYAYRLFDGSLSHHSAPVLMLPSSMEPFFSESDCSVDIEDDKTYVTGYTSSLWIYAASIDFFCKNFNSELYVLEQFSDIVKSVDIFITPPIYTYNQQGKANTFAVSINLPDDDIQKNNFFVGSIKGQTAVDTSHRLYNSSQTAKLIEPNIGSVIVADIPAFSTIEMKEKVIGASTFYHAASLSLQDIINSSEKRTKITIPASVIETLSSREVMTDDYNSHNKIHADLYFEYNSRLNIANIKETLFDGFTPSSLMCYTDKDKINEVSGTWDNIAVPQTFFQAWVYVNKNGKEYILTHYTMRQQSSIIPYFFFYPDINASKVILKNYNTNKYTTLQLIPHPFLNGSYWYGEFAKLSFTDGQDPVATTDNTVSLPNKIYTSEVNNPFYFPVRGINTVGTGEILGITAAVKALSEGQFGQFPLYVFSTDGVWAMEVSDTGTYSTKQPITRDVCNNPASITQLDNSVLFSTDRGLMLIAGSETTPITDILRGRTIKLMDLPFINRLKEDFDILHNFPTEIDFFGYIKSCSLAFDYEGQRIIAYNSNYNYCLMYSLRSQSWTMCEGNYIKTLNSYPDSYVMTSDNKLVNLSDTAMTEDIHGLVLTRPINLDYPDVHKTITRLIQKGDFDRKHIAQVLYGSNDLKNWIAVASSRNAILSGIHGTPYKYFRLLLFTSLDRYESLSGFTVTLEPRQTNKIR